MWLGFKIFEEIIHLGIAQRPLFLLKLIFKERSKPTFVGGDEIQDFGIHGLPEFVFYRQPEDFAVFLGSLFEDAYVDLVRIVGIR